MVDISKDELRSMKIQLAKLQLESKLRSNLTTELDKQKQRARIAEDIAKSKSCLLYTSPSPRDNRTSRMPSSA